MLLTSSVCIFLVDHKNFTEGIVIHFCICIVLV